MSIYSIMGSGYQSLAEQTDKAKQSVSGTSKVATTVSPSPTSAASDTVTLSAEAQAYLDSISKPAAAKTTGFTLNDRQKELLTSILAQYADAPFSQETYNLIQYDLQQAGLAPDQLALQEQVRAFSPSQSLMDALNNKDNNEDMFTQLFGQPVDEEKSNDYMLTVVKQWQALSNTYDADEA